MDRNCPERSRAQTLLGQLLQAPGLLPRGECLACPRGRRRRNSDHNSTPACPRTSLEGRHNGEQECEVRNKHNHIPHHTASHRRLPRFEVGGVKAASRAIGKALENLGTAQSRAHDWLLVSPSTLPRPRASSTRCQPRHVTFTRPQRSPY